MTHVGKYHLVSKLATGGMAEVFLAKVEGPMGFEKTLVLKRILPHLAEDPQFVGMFFTEARVAAQLNHPNIVQIYDFGQASGTYYIAMEYIDGPDLRTLARRALDLGVTLSPSVCARLVSSACEGLSFAHDFVDPASGRPMDLIHRDISPDNLLVSRQGTVKVVDFGIAKASNQIHKTGAGHIKGKLAYMPPEQLQGHGVDRRVDVYALGVVLYELLTGRYPFEASTDVSMMQAILFEPLVPAAMRRPDLPQPLVDILERALSKVREQRYPDCIELQADLERFLGSSGESVGPRDLAQLVDRLCPRIAEPSRPSGSTARGDIGFADTAVRGSTGWFEAPTAPSAPAPLALVPVPAPMPLARVEAPPTPLVPVAPSRVAPPTEPIARVAPASGRRRLAMAVGLLTLGAGSGLLYFHEVSANRPAPEPAPVAAPPARVQAPPPPLPVPPPLPAEPVPAQAVVAAPPPPAEPTAPGEEEVKGATRPSATPPHKAVVKPRLVIRVRPYATVFLDGTALGQTPLPSPIPVSPGEHTVRLINRDLGKDVTRTVDVKAGQPTLFTFDLEGN